MPESPSPSEDGADAIADLLARAGRDGSFAIPVNGRSLAPLVAPGDRALLRPCDATALRRGDLALLRRGAVWAVRLVTATGPLRTAALREREGAEAGTVFARVVAVEREGRRWRWSAGVRLRAFLLHRLLAGPLADGLRRLRSRAPRLRTLGALRARRTGEVHVRVLARADAEAAEGYAARHLPRLRPLIARQLRARWPEHGFALGAFDGAGGVVGFVFVDDYREEGADLPGAWVRGLSVAPSLRGGGVGRALLGGAVEEARARALPSLFADVLEGNRPSLALFASLGFRDADAALAARADAVLRRPGEPRRRVLAITPGAGKDGG